MKIECILKREGGTHVKIGKTDYHFEPQADGAHVADVPDDEHAQRFLSIGEAYKIYRGEAKPAAAEEVDSELVAQYVAKFGKKPHYKLSAEKIQSLLDEEVA